MAANYDRMNTAQLEDEATSRGLNLEEFQALRNNEERAQRLRDHDAATQASQAQAQANAQAAQQAQQDQASQDQAARDQQAQAAQQQAQQAAQDQSADQGQASDSVQVDRGTNGTTAQADRPADVAPYTSDRDLQNRVDAASGNVQTDQPYDEADVPQVGGQNTPTVDGRDQDLNPDDNR
jgi:hypothetical protein